MSSTGFTQNRQFSKERNYDPATVITIKGNITTIAKQSARRGNYPGIHLKVQTSTGEISVHVGPQWYLQKCSLVLNIGDEIQVEGSNIMINGKKTVIARSITTGDKTYELRTPDGVPLWSGQRK